MLHNAKLYCSIVSLEMHQITLEICGTEITDLKKIQILMDHPLFNELIALTRQQRFVS